MIQFTKGIMYQGKNSRFWEYAGRLDNNSPNDLADCQESDVSIYVQPEEEIMQKASDYRNILIIRELKYKELWFPNWGIRSRCSDQKISQSNRLRGTNGGNSIGRQPAHVQNDVQAGRIIFKEYWWFVHSHTCWTNRIRMTITKYFNEYCLTYGSNHYASR